MANHLIEKKKKKRPLNTPITIVMKCVLYDIYVNVFDLSAAIVIIDVLVLSVRYSTAAPSSPPFTYPNSSHVHVTVW